MGEFLTRSTIWISIAAYTVGYVTFTISRGKSTLDLFTRLAWTFAVVALVAHYIFAFQFYHAWSHNAAYIETARQTAEVFSVNSGFGLFINYAVAVLWVGDIGWWWLGGLDSYRRRSRELVAVWHGFLIFIIFNATAVFKHGLQRWLGIAITLCLTVCWFINSNRRRE